MPNEETPNGQYAKLVSSPSRAPPPGYIFDDDGNLCIPYLHAPGGARVRPPAESIMLGEQIFTHRDHDGTFRHWDIGKLKRMIANGTYPVVQVPIEPEEVAATIRDKGIETDHLLRIGETLHNAGILVSFSDGEYLIVDGNHRYVRLHMMGETEMDFSFLTEEEAKPAMLRFASSVTRLMEFNEPREA